VQSILQVSRLLLVLLLAAFSLQNAASGHVVRKSPEPLTGSRRLPPPVRVDVIEDWTGPTRTATIWRWMMLTA